MSDDADPAARRDQRLTARAVAFEAELTTSTFDNGSPRGVSVPVSAICIALQPPLPARRAVWNKTQAYKAAAV